jgi:hypothetical protein
MAVDKLRNIPIIYVSHDGLAMLPIMGFNSNGGDSGGGFGGPDDTPGSQHTSDQLGTADTPATSAEDIGFHEDITHAFLGTPPPSQPADPDATYDSEDPYAAAPADPSHGQAPSPEDMAAGGYNINPVTKEFQYMTDQRLTQLNYQAQKIAATSSLLAVAQTDKENPRSLASLPPPNMMRQQTYNTVVAAQMRDKGTKATLGFQNVPTQAQMDRAKNVSSLSKMGLSFAVPQALSAIPVVGQFLGTAATFGMALSKFNEPPDKTPDPPALGSQSTLTGAYPGEVTMPDPAPTPPSDIEGPDIPKSNIVRAAANNATLAIADEDDFTHQEIRAARNRITRFA